MKNSVKLLAAVIGLAASSVACNTNQTPNTANNSTKADSLNHALEVIKAENAIALAKIERQEIIESLSVEEVPAALPARLQPPTVVKYIEVPVQPPVRPYKSTAPEPAAPTYESTSYDNEVDVPVVNTSETIPQVEEKKRLNEVAKGAIIGAGVGAVTGAIVSKKKGKGAIIGGILGAGAGAAGGKVIQNKKAKTATNSFDKLLTSNTYGY
ncbi:MAG: hypothetical protein ACI9V1_001698 [Spirosomataceae bacterium]|jgi:hypothetical protein